MYVKKAWKCSVLADLILPSDEWDVMRCLSGISLIYLEDCSSSLLLLLGKSGLIEILLFIIDLWLLLILLSGGPLVFYMISKVTLRLSRG